MNTLISASICSPCDRRPLKSHRLWFPWRVTVGRKKLAVEKPPMQSRSHSGATAGGDGGESPREWWEEKHPGVKSLGGGGGREAMHSLTSQSFVSAVGFMNPVLITTSQVAFPSPGIDFSFFSRPAWCLWRPPPRRVWWIHMLLHMSVPAAAYNGFSCWVIVCVHGFYEHTCVFGEISSQSSQLKILKRPLRADLVPSFPSLPQRHLLDRFLSGLTAASHLLSLIIITLLQVYLSPSSLHPTTHTLPWGCCPTLCRLLSTHSLDTVLSTRLSSVAWTCPPHRSEGSFSEG